MAAACVTATQTGGYYALLCGVLGCNHEGRCLGPTGEGLIRWPLTGISIPAR